VKDTGRELSARLYLHKSPPLVTILRQGHHEYVYTFRMFKTRSNNSNLSLGSQSDHFLKFMRQQFIHYILLLLQAVPYARFSSLILSRQSKPISSISYDNGWSTVSVLCPTLYVVWCMSYMDNVSSFHFPSSSHLLFL
jgi:hypothetical protein